MATSFYDYRDLFAVLRSTTAHTLDSDEFYQSAMRLHQSRQDPSAHAHCRWEYKWRKARRPYYRVYPDAIKMLLSLNLSKVLCSALEPPAGLPAMIVDLPKGNALMSSGQDIHHLMIEFDDTQNAHGRMVTFGMHYGEFAQAKETPTRFPIWDTWFTTMVPGRSVDEVLDYINGISNESKNKIEYEKLGLHIPTLEERYRVSSLLCLLCLLDEDPRLVTPDVLNEDANRVTPETLEKYVGKARRRGKVGWSIGKGLDRGEVTPHFRNAHPCIFWVDPGRTRQVVRLRSHSFPNLNKVRDVPTGYKDEEVQPQNE